jgi:hypothetical protein
MRNGKSLFCSSGSLRVSYPDVLSYPNIYVTYLITHVRVHASCIVKLFFFWFMYVTYLVAHVRVHVSCMESFFVKIKK